MPDIIYPLSAFDCLTAGNNHTLAYVLSKTGPQPYDEAPLLAAVKSAAQKWPLLAARVHKDKQSELFYMRIPREQQKEPAQLTLDNYDSQLGFVPVLPSRSGIVDRPALEYFTHPSTPHSLVQYAETSHPLLAIHISHFQDATCIGFTFPRGVFDGTGMGLIVQAIGDELSGKEWTPPPLPERNDFVHILSTLPTDVEREIIEAYKADWPRSTVNGILKHLTRQYYEKMWWSVETKSLYLDKNTVEALVEPVKRDVRAKSGQWVSTGDILLAWFTKAALSDDKPTSKTVSIFSALSIRDSLVSQHPTLKHYPHNAVASCRMFQPLTPAQLSSMSIADVALQHRSQLVLYRKPSFTGALASYLGPPASTTLSPTSTKFCDARLVFSNMTRGRLTHIEFGEGTKVVGFFEWAANTDQGHVYMHEFGGGYTIMGGLRKYRWEAVSKVLQDVQVKDV